MASEKVKGMLRSKGNYFTEAQLDTMTDRDAWASIYERFPPETKKPKDKRPQICFTGFGTTERAVLESRAAEKFNVVSSVTTKLSYLVTGSDPGPAKIAKATEQKTPILSAAQFEELLATGALPTES